MDKKGQYIKGSMSDLGNKKHPFALLMHMLFFHEDKDVTYELDQQTWKRTRLYMFTTSMLVAIWGIFDIFIDFENLWLFLTLRAIYTPLTFLCAWYFYLPVFRNNHKKWALVHYILLILDIGVMVLWTDHFVKYLIGFSTIFWGASVIMLWRFWYTVIPGLAVILIATIRFYFFPHNVADGEFVTGLYYFSTCLVFTTIISAYGYWSAHLLAAKNIALESTFKKLIQSEKMSSMNIVIAGVAHEINTPVGTALTAVSHVKEEFKQLLDVLKVGEVKLDQLQQPAKDGLNSARSALYELERTANLVKRFKQTAVDQSYDEKRRFNLANYIKENIVQLSMQPRLKQKNIAVLVSGQQDIVMDSYPGEISQVFTNLIANTVEHGYHDYPFNQSPERITIDFSQPTDDMVKVEYQDMGIGLSSEVKNHIFDPFFTTKGDYDSVEEYHHHGTGLGMNIVFNIVTQKLGGQIEVGNENNKGALFRIILPLNPP